MRKESYVKPEVKSRVLEAGALGTYMSGIDGGDGGDGDDGDDGDGS